MTRWMRQSLLVQMVGVYLAFALVVLAAGWAVNVLVERQLSAQVQASDLALAQETALDTHDTLTGAASSLEKLSQVDAVRSGNLSAMAGAFTAFMAARSDIDHVYWLDPVGTIEVSVQSRSSLPANPNTGVGAEFSPPDVVQQARLGNGPVFEVGIAEETTYTAGVIIADPVLDAHGHLRGILTASLSLAELSTPLKTVVQAQQAHGRSLDISVVDNRGELVATPDSSRILDTVTGELPGLQQALQGSATTLIGPGPGNQDWLYSSVPVPDIGWAVVVQRPTSDALSIANNFRAWLFLAASLFALGIVLLWVVLLRRVIRPLHLLSLMHRGPGASGPRMAASGRELTQRVDEVGSLARSLERLEHDVSLQLAELEILLQTSNAVVSSLDPQAVAQTIIREVGRLVDVQSATVLVPDDAGVLSVLASSGRSDQYVRSHRVSRDDPHSPAAMALRERRPVQLLATTDDDDPKRRTFPPRAYSEGFRSLLAIPIISRHAGGVVLLVHRVQPVAFTGDEVNLLLTFANYATLAWEHAVLYERSDERLREIAQENARLYREAAAEQQTLAAIMGSLSDGLVLTSVDGAILYANRGAHVIAHLDDAALDHQHVAFLYETLKHAAESAEAHEALNRAETGALSDALIEIAHAGSRQAIHLRLFDVRDETGEVIGRGLLLRDVTREREVDQFKTTLLATVGHELRTPLAAIKGHASTLLQDDIVWPLEDQRHFLSTISGEADRLARLVSNLLDLSRQEAGLLLLKRAPCRLQDLVTRAVEQMSNRGVSITVQATDEVPALEVDAPRIEVVLHNLLANAITYGEGEVYITVERRDASAVVSISDNGPGMAPDEVPHAFERFFRAQRGRQQRSGGTGLGLAICKAFVEAHGGHIWAETKGHHMTISFSLPLTAAAVAETPAMPLAAVLPGPVKRSQL